MAEKKVNWSGERVMLRWKVSSTELAAYIYDGLPAYRMEEGKFKKVAPEELRDFDMEHMTDLLFFPAEVMGFEKELGFAIKEDQDNQSGSLDAKEARELGLLRREKAKWESSIKVALQIGMHCINLDHQITRDELTDAAYGIDAELPDTTIDKIWQAIPDKYKKGAGRPRKA